MVSGDVARERALDVVARLRDQVADIAAVGKRRAALRVEGVAAGGTVVVTVNAGGQLVKAVVDKSYLDDHEFEELGGHVVEAARSAAGEAAGRVEELMAPIAERHRGIPSFSELVDGLPDMGDVLSGLEVAGGGRSAGGGSGSSPVGGDDDGEGGAGFFTVRR
jgi:DNA-binding protein YbaB